ncbi:MAG: hypothetical protein J6J20_04835 [Muribaculaceae bacterium]|nr:hypothetical protein [Muribaculaceae bacterium]
MRLRAVACALALLLPAVACHHLDDDRVPLMPVWLSFNSQAEWQLYGVTAAMDAQLFVKQGERHEWVPPQYQYSAISETGYGGLLLVCDVMGTPKAYDAACPVEIKRTVRVFINDDNKAECPQCHSTYDVFSLDGHPLSGRAADEGWGLRRFSVGPGSRGEYMVVRR